MFNTTQRLSWLSSLATAAFLGLMALLSGCGGGGVAAINQTGPLVVSPAEGVAYNGTPVTMYITGGDGPYTVTSSDSAIIGVPYNVSGSTFTFDASNVTADTEVTLTVRDAQGQIAAAVITVMPSVINNALTVTPDPAAPGTGCGTAVCSGMMASVSVQLRRNLGTPLPNRAVRFDVVQGDYQFITNSAATTFADTITTNTDQNGYAHVRLRANPNAPTQYAILKVTDVAGGSVLQTTFTIAQYTDGTGILSVVPDTHTITTYYKGICSSGVRVDYIIHGGTPPYTVRSTSTGVATVTPATVLANGTGFTAVTQNGFCPGEATFDIRDATGRYITATLKNEEGTEDLPSTTVALYAPAVATVAAGSAISVNIGGGVAPYYVSSGDLTKATASVIGNALTITGVAPGTATITVSDAKGDTVTIDVTITP